MNTVFFSQINIWIDILLTIVVEVLIHVAFGLRKIGSMVLLMVMNVVTVIIANLALNRWLPGLVGLAFVMVGVILFEWVLVKLVTRGETNWKKALEISIVANFISFGVGEIILLLGFLSR